MTETVTETETETETETGSTLDLPVQFEPAPPGG